MLHLAAEPIRRLIVNWSLADRGSFTGRKTQVSTHV